METALTREIKSELLLHYRYVRGMYAVQECYNKDVLVCDKHFEHFYEFEIKVSKSDLKCELKKDKHKFFPNITYFYFVVPPILAEEAVEICEYLNPKYGVMTYCDTQFHVVRNAKRLDIVPRNIERALLNKMSSDYVKWYAELQLYRNDRMKYIPKNCSKRAHTIYYNLLKHLSTDIIQEFDYIEESDEIVYGNHRIIFQETQVKVDSKKYKYSGKWIENTVLAVLSWCSLSIFEGEDDRD